MTINTDMKVITRTGNREPYEKPERVCPNPSGEETIGQILRKRGFDFPYVITDGCGNEVYIEERSGFWREFEYGTWDGEWVVTRCLDSNGCLSLREYAFNRDGYSLKASWSNYEDTPTVDDAGEDSLPSDGWVITRYDHKGRETEVQYDSGYTKTLEYDEKGILIRSEDPDQLYTYDASFKGWLLEKLGKRTRHQYIDKTVDTSREPTVIEPMPDEAR